MKPVFFVLIVVTGVLFHAAEASDWPQFQNDAHHSGISKDRVPEGPSIIWSADVQKIDATPIISGSAVYVLAGNGSLYAFDCRNGEALWHSQMNGWAFQTATPASSGDLIFAATDSGILSAFSARTGEVLWNRSISNKRLEAPIMYIDGRIYIGEGSAYGREEKKFISYFENGTECWVHSDLTQGYQWCGPCAAGDYLIFGQNDGHLKSVNRFNGSLSDELYLNDSSRIGFSRQDPGRIRSSVSFCSDSIYTTSEMNAERGYAWKIGFDTTTGRFLDQGWSTDVGFSTSTPAVVGDRVYLGVGEHGHTGALVCINEKSGDTIWSYPVPAGIKSSPAISTGSRDPEIVFSASAVNGSIYCIKDAGYQAELIWTFNPPDDGYILSGVAISDGRVYFGTEGDEHCGKLYCLGDVTDAESSLKLRDNPERGGIYALNATNGETVWSYQQGDFLPEIASGIHLPLAGAAYMLF